MKELFECYLRIEGVPQDFEMWELFQSSMGTCLCIWYALLFATCEGVENDGKVSICTSIDPNYAKVREQLRRFRNATFHVHADVEPKKLMAVFLEKGIVPKIRGLHQRVGEYLVHEIRELPSYQAGVRKADQRSGKGGRRVY
jgi:hypothetical protein